MKFKDLFEVLYPSYKIFISMGCDYYPYYPDELKEDFVFFEQIKDKTVTSVWYNDLYRGLWIEIE